MVVTVASPLLFPTARCETPPCSPFPLPRRRFSAAASHPAAFRPRHGRPSGMIQRRSIGTPDGGVQGHARGMGSSHTNHGDGVFFRRQRRPPPYQAGPTVAPATAGARRSVVTPAPTGRQSPVGRRQRVKATTYRTVELCYANRAIRAWFSNTEPPMPADRLRRRDILIGLGGLTAASSGLWPLAARTQQTAILLKSSG